MAPDTTKVIVVKPDEAAPGLPSREVHFVLTKVPTKLRFFLGPAVSNDNVAAFWCITSTSKLDEANMEMRVVKRRCAASLAFDATVIVSEASSHPEASGLPGASGQTSRRRIPEKNQPKDPAAKAAIFFKDPISCRNWTPAFQPSRSACLIPRTALKNHWTGNDFFPCAVVLYSPSKIVTSMYRVYNCFLGLR